MRSKRRLCSKTGYGRRRCVVSIPIFHLFRSGHFEALRGVVTDLIWAADFRYAVCSSSRESAEAAESGLCVDPVEVSFLSFPYLLQCLPTILAHHSFSCISLEERVDPTIRANHLRLIDKVLRVERQESEPAYRALVALGNVVSELVNVFSLRNYLTDRVHLVPSFTPSASSVNPHSSTHLRHRTTPWMMRSLQNLWTRYCKCLESY